jgi:tRNA (cmo5U34)-methyltransferase
VKKVLNKNLIKISKSWSFNKNVSNNFDHHVAQSIPFYKEINKTIVSISEFFMKENSVVYDLGCSTGNIIYKLCKLNLSHPVEIYGVDREVHMLKIAKKKLTSRI